MSDPKVKCAGIVCRKPTFAETDRFMAGVTSNKITASRALVLACLESPSIDDARATIEAKPAIVLGIANKLLEIAGSDAEVTVEGN